MATQSKITPQANAIWARLQTIGAKRVRAFRAHCGASRRLMAAAHPETGGNLGLVHNWGNEAARAIRARCDARWRAYADASDIASRNAMRDYVRATGGNPIW